MYDFGLYKMFHAGLTENIPFANLKKITQKVAYKMVHVNSEYDQIIISPHIIELTGNICINFKIVV